MANPIERASKIRQFNERVAAIASEHRTLDKQRRAVAELLREMPVPRLSPTYLRERRHLLTLKVTTRICGSLTSFTD